MSALSVRVTTCLALLGISISQLGADETTISVETSISEKEERIYDILEKHVTFNFDEIEIKDLVEWISSKFDIEVQIDIRELNEEGILTNDTVSLIGGPIRLKYGLKGLLMQCDLEAIVHDDVLLVTTIFDAEYNSEYFETRVYNIRPLKLRKKKDNLVWAIRSFIGEDTWEDNEGIAGIELVKGSLIVRQIPRHHEQIENLLNQMHRDVQRNRNNKSNKDAQPAFIAR